MRKRRLAGGVPLGYRPLRASWRHLKVPVYWCIPNWLILTETDSAIYRFGSELVDFASGVFIIELNCIRLVAIEWDWLFSRVGSTTASFFCAWGKCERDTRVVRCGCCLFVLLRWLVETSECFKVWDAKVWLPESQECHRFRSDVM